jgi:hypothetical protein
VSSKCFQLCYTSSDSLLATALPLSVSIFSPSYCDVSYALGYLALTIRCCSGDDSHVTTQGPYWPVSHITIILCSVALDPRQVNCTNLYARVNEL